MGSKRTLFDALQGKFEEEKYTTLTKITIDGYKIKVIELIDKQRDSNTPIKAVLSDAYICVDKVSMTPKQITFYRSVTFDDVKWKSSDYDLEVHNHDGNGYVGNPHAHDYTYPAGKDKICRGDARELTKAESKFIDKIIAKLKKEGYTFNE